MHDRVWNTDFLDDEWTEISTITDVNTTNGFDVPQAIISKASIPKALEEPANGISGTGNKGKIIRKFLNSFKFGRLTWEKYGRNPSSFLNC